MNWLLFILFTTPADGTRLGNEGRAIAHVQDARLCMALGESLTQWLNWSDSAAATSTVFSFRCVERPSA